MPALTDFWQRYAPTDAGVARVINKNTYRAPQIGMIDAVVGNENKGGFQQDFNLLTGGGGDSKKKIAVFKYHTRGVDADTLDETDSELNYCTPARTNEFLQSEQEVTRYVSRQFKIEDNKVKNFDESARQHFQMEIEMEAIQLVTDLNKRMIALYEAARGNTSAGTTAALTAQAFSSAADYKANIAWQESIRREFRKIQSGGRLMMVGDGLSESYANVLGYGQINEFGQRVDMQPFDNRFAFFGDATLDATIDGTGVITDNALVWEPGAFQMLHWYQNRGDFRKMRDDAINDTIAVNVNGTRYVFDIFIRYSDCTDSEAGMHVTLKKWFDVWNYPSDIFKGTDTLNGVNFLERWIATAA